MGPKIYKAGEVCELVQLQPYVLRSWEKEFPGIGVQTTPESPRLYRQSDLEHVQRIKQLVFTEGLTVAGARRRLEESAPSKTAAAEAAEVLEAMSADARTRLRRVRDSLRELKTMLSGGPRASGAAPSTASGAGPSGASPQRRAAAVARTKATQGRSRPTSAAKAGGRGKPASSRAGRRGR